ncbi:MAG: hypothetical protein EBT43_05345 [Methylocystaceae bacterium]|nr:hypothetical protein [Methylocystaceae bacterium]
MTIGAALALASDLLPLAGTVDFWSTGFATLIVDFTAFSVSLTGLAGVFAVGAGAFEVGAEAVFSSAGALALLTDAFVM